MASDSERGIGTEVFCLLRLPGAHLHPERVSSHLEHCQVILYGQGPRFVLWDHFIQTNEGVILLVPVLDPSGQQWDHPDYNAGDDGAREGAH